MERVNHLVVGGGVYGSHIALALEEAFPHDRTLLLESSEELLSGASTHNHGRLHGGYQYPLDSHTAMQARDDVGKFVNDYGSTVQKARGAYNGIHRDSVVSPLEYEQFCDSLNLAYRKTDAAGLFGQEIAAAYEVDETSFSLSALQRLVIGRVNNSGVEVHHNTRVESITKDGMYNRVGIAGEEPLLARNVFNCTYGQINNVHLNSNLPILPITNDKYVLFGIDLPEELRDVSATVMYGPFGSIVANDNWGTHVLAHVIHSNIERTKNFASDNTLANADDLSSRAFAALRDTRQYLLPLSEATRQTDMVWNRAVLGDVPEKGVRSAFMQTEYGGLQGYNVVLGGKMTGFYRAVDFAIGAVMNNEASSRAAAS
jgi:hypothetical protein